MGLVGWVRNLANGMVETMVCGKDENVLAFEAIIKKGPRLGSVREVNKVREFKAPEQGAQQWVEFKILPDGDVS